MPLRYQLVVPGDGVAQVNLGFERAGLRVRDLRPAWRVIHRHLIERVLPGQFESEGRRSTGWRPLSPNYLAEKLRRWGPRPILQASGRMMRAFTTRNADHIEESKPLEMRFGVRDASVPYAKFHQAGTTRMPRRRPFELTTRDRTFIEEVIVEAIRDELLAGRA